MNVKLKIQAFLASPRGFYKTFCSLEEEKIKNHSGLEPYFFLRFLRLAAFASILGSLFITPVISTVNAHILTKEQKDSFNLYGTNWHLMPEKPKMFYWFHLVAAVSMVAGVIKLINSELIEILEIRNQHISEQDPTKYPRHCTVLLQNIPAEIMQESKIKQLFSIFPDSLRKIWLIDDLRELSEVYKKQKYVRDTIETQYVRWLRNSQIQFVKLSKKAECENTDPIHIIDEAVRLAKPRASYLSMKISKNQNKDVIEQLLCYHNTLAIKLKEKEQETPKRWNSAFIQFKNPWVAYATSQIFLYHDFTRLRVVKVGIHPADIHWENLQPQNRLVNVLKKLLGISLLAALISFWGVPAAFIILLSNLEVLLDLAPWLAFLAKFPKPIICIIIGTVPPLFLSFMMSLLPYAFRIVCQLDKGISKTDTELYMQKIMFWQLIIQTFFVTVISRTPLGIIKDTILSPVRSLFVLSIKVPQSATFYICFLIIRGLLLAGSELLSIRAVASVYILNNLRSGTARQKYMQSQKIGKTRWGEKYAAYSNLTVIVVIFSVISPLILPISGCIFAVQYIIWKGSLSDSHCSRSTLDGATYIQALEHMYTGLYIFEVVIACLFCIIVDANEKHTCIPQAYIMVVTLFLTIASQVSLRKRTAKAKTSVPLDWAIGSPEQPSKDDQLSLEIAQGTSDGLMGRTSCEQVPRHVVWRWHRQQSQMLGYHVKEAMKETCELHSIRTTTSSEDKASILSSMCTSLPKLSKCDRSYVLTHLYTHPIYRLPDMTIWVPDDPFEIAKHEIQAIKEKFPLVNISSDNSQLTNQGHVAFYEPPPDYDIFDHLDL
ncbi:hypothetical protein CANCADRAFT_2928 [Tortispora caseinolytica NRRL Y-17796]|uniref:CSC1/OSCA1-like 7TM region domain-containing protein n=1 Tax=Tortispora caseinolytica NRRL Y-17796 TaxID=767744 RepID=A0A1E4THH6_9ASCO|nr:hypothetical protein CANCADRAFT_2928 [Tortispora caseinolytica NRRL Y-17796]